MTPDDIFGEAESYITGTDYTSYQDSITPDSYFGINMIAKVGDETINLASNRTTDAPFYNTARGMAKAPVTTGQMKANFVVPGGVKKIRKNFIQNFSVYKEISDMTEPSAGTAITDILVDNTLANTIRTMGASTLQKYNSSTKALLVNTTGMTGTGLAITQDATYIYRMSSDGNISRILKSTGVEDAVKLASGFSNPRGTDIVGTTMYVCGVNGLRKIDLTTWAFSGAVIATTGSAYGDIVKHPTLNKMIFTMSSTTLRFLDIATYTIDPQLSTAAGANLGRIHIHSSGSIWCTTGTAGNTNIFEIDSNTLHPYTYFYFLDDGCRIDDGLMVGDMLFLLSANNPGRIIGFNVIEKKQTISRNSLVYASTGIFQGLWVANNKIWFSDSTSFKLRSVSYTTTQPTINAISVTQGNQNIDINATTINIIQTVPSVSFYPALTSPLWIEV